MNVNSPLANKYMQLLLKIFFCYINIGNYIFEEEAKEKGGKG